MTPKKHTPKELEELQKNLGEIAKALLTLGYVILPVKPDAQMLEEGENAFCDANESLWGGREIYDAMVRVGCLRGDGQGKKKK